MLQNLFSDNKNLYASQLTAELLQPDCLAIEMTKQHCTARLMHVCCLVSLLTDCAMIMCLLYDQICRTKVGDNIKNTPPAGRCNNWSSNCGTSNETINAREPMVTVYRYIQKRKRKSELKQVRIAQVQLICCTSTIRHSTRHVALYRKSGLTMETRQTKGRQ